MNRRNQKAVFFSALAVLCLVSFIAGRMGSASGSSRTLDGGAHSRTIKRGDVNNRGSKLRVRSHADDRISSFGTVGSRHAIARMESIMRKRIPMERTAAWLQLVKSLDQDQIRDMVDYLHAQDVDYRNRPEYLMLFDAWIDIDSHAAMEYADASITHKLDKQAVLTTWANKDPMAAMRWAQQKDEGDRIMYRVLGVINGIGSADPQLATQMLNDIPPTSTSYGALRPLKVHYLAQGVEEARNWCLTIEHDSLRASAIRSVSYEQSKIDPQGAADWLLANMHEGERIDNGAITDVMAVMTRSDAQAAIAYLNTINTPIYQSNALKGIAGELSKLDPHAALSLMDSNPSIVNDGTLRFFTNGALSKEPELAANTISRFQDIEAGDRQYRSILGSWLRQDYDAAIKWINQNDLSAGVHEYVDKCIEHIRKTSP